MDTFLAYKLNSGAIFTDKGKRVTVTYLKLAKETKDLNPGDVVKATGKSKGRGFAGVMKRHGFSGVGGRTHGQSDRQRHPGSIGMRTTPGRIWKGKRMAGRYGNETITIKKLEIIKIEADQLTISGTIPGSRNALIKLQKYGQN